MAGIHAQTGKALDDLAHVRQSIRDILTTPLGSRVLLRDYGSRLFELVDSALTASGRMAIYQAVVTAFVLWEPRFSVQKVEVTSGTGSMALDLTGIYRPNGQKIKLSGIEIGSVS
ncbi:GPW/gp25 family protein [Acetobacteraceae bacterium ESL0709]|nr:GPW/gp25 family protein [Acetobacteraceae bacterium ESL0697]MDF7677403.1 GPW/gp25 family protein [Acetobacteraceae bacterium ESL0709]